MFKTIFYLVLSLLIVALLVTLAYFGYQWHQERKVLQQIVERASAVLESAESRSNEASGKLETTIKFLEYDASGKPLEPRYFTFQGNIIQFQSLVIRFKDEFVNAGDSLRGKSIYLFLRAFVLDEKNAQVFNITEMNGIPKGYKIPNVKSDFERKLWEEFWTLALDPKAREREGIKNAQIEAPGSIFLPGTIYTLQIEHDGGIRIDTEPVPEILKDELQK